MIILYVGDSYLCKLDIDKKLNTELFSHTNITEMSLASTLFIAPILSSNKTFYMEWKVYTEIFKNQIPIHLMPKDSKLYIYTETVDARTQEYKYLKEHATIIKLDEMDESVLKTWTRNRCSELGLRPESRALDLLIQYMNLNSQAIHNELKKFKSFGKDVLTEKDVRQYVSTEKDFKFYELSNALTEFKKSDAFYKVFVIYRYMKKSNDSFSIIRYLQNFFLNLITAKIQTKLLESKYSPFAAKKFAEVANKYSMKKLESNLDYCYTAELEIKSGVNEEIVLSILLCLLLKG